MNLEFIRYPNESDDDFVYRIKRSTKELGYKILKQNAKGPEDVYFGVNLRKIITENGTRFKYETK